MHDDTTTEAEAATPRAVGFSSIPNDLVGSVGGSEVSCYLALASYTRPQRGRHVVWASVKKIAQKIGRSERLVRQKYLRRLEAAGWVSIERRPGRTHRITVHQQRIAEHLRTSPTAVAEKAVEKVVEKVDQVVAKAADVAKAARSVWVPPIFTKLNVPERGMDPDAHRAALAAARRRLPGETPRERHTRDVS